VSLHEHGKKDFLPSPAAPVSLFGLTGPAAPPEAKAI